MTTPERLSDEEIDELVKLFRAGHAAAPVPSTPDERIRAGLAVALVASGYRREADVLREAADTIEARYPTDIWLPESTSPDAMAAKGVRVACNQLRHIAEATALEPAQPLPVAADVCGEVGIGWPNGSYADPAYTEPCALPFDHEEPHDWAQREAAAEGQECSEEKEHG